MQRAALLFAVMATACMSVSKTVLDTSFQPNPIAEEDVVVYVAGDNIPEHTRVATLEGKSDETWTNEKLLRNKMRKEAGQLGANAIIWLGIREAEPGLGDFFRFVINAQQFYGSAVAIYVPSLGRAGNDNR